MSETSAILLFLHLLGGATWLGASVFANLVVLPYIGRQPSTARPDLVGRLILGPERLVIGSALLAGTTGLLLGVVGGRIAGLDDLAGRYGMLWVASIAIAVAVFATGGLVTSRAAKRLAGAVGGDATSAGPPGDEDRLRLLRVGFALELTGIVAVLAVMVLLGRS